MRILMSAAASPAAVSIVRHLAELGHEVTGMDAGPEAAALGHQFCHRFFVCPPVDQEAYFDFLIEQLRSVDLFLPYLDEELLRLATEWPRLPVDLADKVAMSDPATILDCVDKCRFQRECVAAGLPVAPETDSAPAFFKPRFGRGSKGVMAIDNDRIFSALKDRQGVFQKAVDGQEYTIDAVFDSDGNLVGTCSRRRIRSAGVSTIGETSADRRHYELARKLGERWRFRFAINFQVIRDNSDRDWLIELNPRLSGSGIFSALAGFDPFAGTIALAKGEKWSGVPKPLRVWRYWEQLIGDPGS
jgi:carbamoyl-phosphate synthase large subunit